MRKFDLIRLLLAGFISLGLSAAEESDAQAQRKVPIRLGVDVSTMGLAFWIADNVHQLARS